jgi:outer membrane protein
MKKMMMSLVALTAMYLVGMQQADAQAQPNKFGYFDLEYVVGLMPGVEKVDSLMATFERDSLNPEYQFEFAELSRMDSTLKADSAKMPARLYQQRQQEQAQRFYKLQNWQQYTQQVMQGKQQELMAPYLNKVFEAFQNVVTEGKYTYVFKRDGLWIAPPADNLIPLVAKKLGLKLPQDPNMPAEAGDDKKPAAKPAPKPAGKQ